MKNLGRPNAEEYAPYYETYVSKVVGDNFLEQLKSLKTQTIELLQNLSPEKWNFRYAPDKWTIKEVMIHIMDTERIFTYRALRVSRGDQTPLPGFEQNGYVPFYHAEERSAESIIGEYEAVRNATLHLFQNFSEADMKRTGTASGAPVTPLSLGFITLGHELHHLQILKERYGLEKI